MRELGVDGLKRFSDLTFFVVHAGAAFLEQTASLLDAFADYRLPEAVVDR